MKHIRQQAQDAVDRIRKDWDVEAKAGIVLGTGLGGLTDQIEVACRIPYSEIPHFPESTAPSHAGQLVCGTLHGIPLVAIGADTLVCTSAVGGMNPQFALADIVIIEDHINLLPDNPLRGVNDDELGPRFPDMSEPYSKDLVELARTTALDLSISAHKGVLVVVAGPNLETRAEYRMLRQMGADIVGMSTAPEIIVAKHAGMKTLGFSIVTDMCLPDALEEAELEKIIAVAADGGAKLERLLSELFQRMNG